MDVLPDNIRMAGIDQSALLRRRYVSFPPLVFLTLADLIATAGILSCFISSYQYIIDVYGTNAASALSALTFVRYTVTGGAVMFTEPMYERLGGSLMFSPRD